MGCLAALGTRTITRDTSLAGEPPVVTLSGCHNPFRAGTYEGNSSFADRDILMRYHWGMGVGHTYAHAMTPSSLETKLIDIDDDDSGCQASSAPMSTDHFLDIQVST